MDDFILGLASFVIMLVPMIFLHELGHFIAAKLVGITVLEFGLGIPPRAAKLFERGGTEYTLNWLPIGGFVRPLGEDFVRPVGDEVTIDERQIAIQRGVPNPKSVNEAGPWERIFFMSAGAVVNVLTAVLLFIGIGLIGGRQVLEGVTIVLRDVPVNSIAAGAGLEDGDIILAVDGESIESSEAFAQYLAFNEGLEVSLTVERDDESFDVSLFPEASTQQGTAGQVFVTEVVPGTPAAAIGLSAGDIFISANGDPIETLDDVTAIGENFGGQVVALEMERDGEILDFEITPRANPPLNQGAMGVIITIEYVNDTLGATYAIQDTLVRYESMPLGEAASYGVERTVDITRLFVELPIMLVRGELSLEMARPVSIVGISQLGGVRLEQSLESESLLPILELAAFVSLALGLTNLLPIPGLDGGRILFVIVELLRGKPMDPEREGMVHLVGLFILLGLMGIVILNDIINPITEMLP